MDHWVDGHNIRMLVAAVEGDPVDGWRTYTAADAGAFLCDTHGVAVAGTMAEVHQAMQDHTAP